MRGTGEVTSRVPNMPSCSVRTWFSKFCSILSAEAASLPPTCARAIISVTKSPWSRGYAPKKLDSVVL